MAERFYDRHTYFLYDTENLISFVSDATLYAFENAMKIVVIGFIKRNQHFHFFYFEEMFALKNRHLEFVMSVFLCMRVIHSFG